MYEKQVQQYEQQARVKDKWLKGLFFACAALTTVLIGILILDVLSGIGLFQY